MVLDRQQLLALLPHQGRMCLLQQVLLADEHRIVARASSHTEADHPLRALGRLSVLTGVEYAAQAMAIHAALLSRRAGANGASGANATIPRSGRLASVRKLVCHRPRLDDLAGLLEVNASLVMADEQALLYEFALVCEGAPVMSGRAAIHLLTIA